MLREIARSYETAVAQIENFAKPEEVKQEERENVNRLLKKSSAGRFANFNKPKGPFPLRAWKRAFFVSFIDLRLKRAVKIEASAKKINKTNKK